MGDMTRRDIDELTQGLRSAAEWFDSLSDEDIDVLPWITFSDYLGVTVYAGYDKEKNESIIDEFNTRLRLRHIAQLFGKANKDYYGKTFSLQKIFSERVMLTITGPRSAICRKVVKETIEHPAEVVPAQPAQQKDAWTEEVVEWVCDDPLLRTRDDEVATA